jgi:hypothetical protein
VTLSWKLGAGGLVRASLALSADGARLGTFTAGSAPWVTAREYAAAAVAGMASLVNLLRQRMG